MTYFFPLDWGYLQKMHFLDRRGVQFYEWDPVYKPAIHVLL